MGSYVSRPRTVLARTAVLSIKSNPYLPKGVRHEKSVDRRCFEFLFDGRRHVLQRQAPGVRRRPHRRRDCADLRRIESASSRAVSVLDHVRRGVADELLLRLRRLHRSEGDDYEEKILPVSVGAVSPRDSIAARQHRGYKPLLQFGRQTESRKEAGID